MSWLEFAVGARSESETASFSRREEMNASGEVWNSKLSKSADKIMLRVMQKTALKLVEMWKLVSSWTDSDSSARTPSAAFLGSFGN